MNKMIEAEAVSQPISKVAIEQKSARQERNRLIAHLGRVFARRYDIQVLPSRQKGVWACSLDPKTAVEMESYVRGQRRTLDDLPAESFRPKQILYDEQSAQEMSMEQITTLMHHEAGHAKYTDFRLMVEGQKQAKDEGHLPTSFWLTFEGIEDPRVNQLEGEESPAIDRQIRANQARDLQERITEMPIGQRPQMLQFAYNSFHYWLHGKPIPELAGTDVGRVTELARPLLEQYFQNSDPEERKLLQKQIWDISKELEKKDIEQEEMRQMAQQKRQQQGGQNGQGGQPGGAGGQQQEQSGEGQESQSGSGSGGGGQGQESQGAGMPHIPGGSGGGTPQQQSTEMSQQGQESSSRTGGNEGQGKGRKRFLDRLKETIFGSKDKSGSNSQNQGESGQQNRNGGSSEQSQGGDQMKPGSRQNEEFGHDINKPTPKPKPEKLDLSKLSNEELQELRDAINQLTPEQRAELAKKAREAVDEEQKESLKDRLSKLLKLEKNKQTGEYEAILQRVDDKTRKQAEADYKQALQEVEAEEQAEWQRQEQERLAQEAFQRQLDQQRREKQEMEKAGFNEDERDKFLLYQALEDSMYSYVRNFKQAIEKVIPRKKEPKWETGYYSGPKFDKRELVKKVPTGNNQFWQRQVDAPTGEPRLFIGLLVDNSGSMSGKKMEEARKTMIFFAKVCKDMGIPFMAAAFGDRADVVKTFRQDFDNPSERIKPRLIDSTDASGGSTNLHAGIEVTIDAMNEQRRRLRDCHGLIFVITDGGANRGLTGEALKNYIDENRGRLTFKGFGLSGSDWEKSTVQNDLNLYLGESNCAYPQGFEDLPDEAFRVLRINLIQFQRFIS